MAQKKARKPQKKKLIGDQTVGIAPGGHKVRQSPYGHYSPEQICRFILTYWHFMMERDSTLSINSRKQPAFSTRFGSYDAGKRKEIKKFLYDYKGSQKMHRAEVRTDKISELLQETYFELSHEVLVPFVYLKIKELQDAIRNMKKIDTESEKEIKEFFRKFYLYFISTENNEAFQKWYAFKREPILKIISKRLSGENNDTIDLACQIMQKIFEDRNFSTTKLKETIDSVEEKIDQLIEHIPDPKQKMQEKKKIWVNQLLEFSIFDPSEASFHRSIPQLIEYLLGFLGLHPELTTRIISLIDFGIIERPPFGKLVYETYLKGSRPLRNKKELDKPKIKPIKENSSD